MTADTDGWRAALEQPVAAAGVATLVLESEATPGVLALEVAYGEGPGTQPHDGCHRMIRALAEHAPADWLDVGRGHATRAA